MNDSISNRLVTGWMLRGSNPGSGEIFRTRPFLSWGPPNLMYRVSFLWLNTPDRVFDHHHNIPPILKERLDLSLYSLFGTSRPVTGRA